MDRRLLLKALAQGPAFIFKSVICSAWFRLRGVKSSLVTCEGRLPVLRTKGTFEAGSRLMIRGLIARCEIGATERDALLRIGSRVLINQGTVIVAARHIEIGDDTLIGDFSRILDSNWHRVDPGHPTREAPVTIGSNVWLGSGVTVLPGSKIGDHTVVAAGSVVKGELPERVLATGNPAQVVRELEIPDGWVRG